MKVFVVWTVPDYIGIDIEGIYSSLDKAEKKVQKIKESYPYLIEDHIGIDEYEVDDE